MVLYLVRRRSDGKLCIVGQAEFNSQKWEFFAKLENSKISPPKNHSPRYRAFLKWLWENGFENPLEQVWSTDFLSEKQTPPVGGQADSAPRNLTAGTVAGFDLDLDLKNATGGEVLDFAAQMLRNAVEAVGAAEAGEAGEAVGAVEDPTPAESVHGIAPPPPVQEKTTPPSGAAPGHNTDQDQREVWGSTLITLSDGTIVQVTAPLDMSRAMMLTPVPAAE